MNRQATPLSRDALADRVYGLLRSRIIDLQLPPGERLNIDRLAQDVGVSHTPLREALNRLASERLVSAEPYRGFTVTPLLDETGLRQLLDGREVIECGALERAADQITAAELTELDAITGQLDELAAADELDVREFNELDARFHRLTVAACRNPFLLDAYDDLKVHAQLARLYQGRSVVQARRANDEHRRFLEALRGGDVAGLLAAARDHINGVYRRLASEDTGEDG
ncbi:MAG: FCD domain-containing protein [Streptosporangiales bacterium]|nr:FCD domain-containing protein [Streptosporangiales bacterium]